MFHNFNTIQKQLKYFFTFHNLIESPESNYENIFLTSINILHIRTYYLLISIIEINHFVLETA